MAKDVDEVEEDVREEDLIPFAECRKFGQLVTTANMNYWADFGLKNKLTKQRYHLRWVQRGGKRCTTKKWYEEFVRLVNKCPAGK